MRFMYLIFLTVFLQGKLFSQEGKKTLIVPYISITEKKSELFIPSIFVSGNKAAVAKVLVDSSGTIRAGLIDGSGRFIVKPVYKDFGNYEHGFIPLLRTNGKVDFFSIPLKRLMEEESDDYKIITPSIIFTSDNFKWGATLVLHDVNTINKIPRIYKSVAYDSSRGLIDFLNFNNWQVTGTENDPSSSGKYLYDSIFFQDEEHFVFFRNGKQGKASTIKGELVLAGEYFFREVNETPYDWGSSISKVETRHQLLFQLGLYQIDSLGKFIFTFNPDTYQSYHKPGAGLIRVKGKEGMGVIDTTGKVVVPVIYDSIRGPFVDDRVFITYKGKLVSIFDDKGMLLSEPQERSGKIFDFVEGRARFVKAGYIGFIDVRGNIRVAPQYKEIRDFKEGLSAVVLKGKWGFIDKDENIIVQPLYDEVKDYQNGITAVRKGREWFFLDKKGGRTSVSSYDSVLQISNGKWIVFRVGKKGLVSVSGKELLAPRYDSIEDVKENFAIVEKSGKWGVVDYEENFIIMLKYDQVTFSPVLNKFLTMEKGKVETFSISGELRK